MKRLLLFFVAAFLILACSKDEEAIPVAPKSKFNLTIVATEGGSVSTTGGSYEEGSTVSVTATAASGYRFVEWSNGETTATINITVLGNITLTATFEKLAYSIEVSGAIAKGAFATGSTLTFYELTKALSQTGKTFNTDITDKYGSYSLSVEEVTEDYARVVGEGFYWNEVTNKTTSEKITLNALSEIKEGVNVNILTHLEYPRVEQLVKTEGKSFSDAKRQALIEVLSSLGIETTTDYGSAEQFNFVNGDDRSKILAVASVIIQAERSPAEVTAFITEVANDLKDNGSIDNTELKTEIAIPLAKIDLQKTATNIYNHYKEQNPELSAEDYISDYLETAKAEFQQYLPDADGDGVQDDLDQCPDTPSDEEADSNGCGKSQKAYQLTTTVEGSGSISEEIIVQPTASYDYGTTVRVTANPIVGWEFKEWKGDISSTEISYDILIQEEVSVTAVFVRKQYGLDLTIEGEGSVSKNPDQSSYEYQSNVELTATPAEGWVFKEWRGDLPSDTNPITVAFNSDKEMVAVFQRKTYDLNITISGEGAVAEEVITTPGRYEGGTAVELTATPANGWVFTGWSGDITSDQNPINITLTEEKNITATFTKKNFTLTTSKDGEGSVVVDPEKEAYEFKTPIKITAAAAEGWAFNKWTGDIESEENPLNIEIDDNLTVNAVFKRKQYDLTVTIEGEGTVEEEIVVAPTKYDYETQVKLTAVAKEGWEFASWGGDLQGTENPATITVTKGQAVTATFTAIPGGIYLDSNGVTIKANVTAKVGERYLLEDTGEEYLVVDEEMLRQMLVDGEDVGKVVTTKVINMDTLFDTDTPYQGEYTGDISTWDTSNVTSMESVFSGHYIENEDETVTYIYNHANPDITHWDVSSVTSFYSAFFLNDSFNQDIGNWDISSATNLRSMFNRASVFNQDISGWDTSNVENMTMLFRGQSAFNQDISEWNTSNVKSMYAMFYDNSSFTQNINSWNTSSVEDMSWMFASSTYNRNIGNWDTSSVVLMNSMFEDNTEFNQDISNWNVSNVTNMWAMFYGTPFNQPIGNWNVSNVTIMQALFSNNTAFNQDITNWDVSNVENMSWMFQNASAFNQDISDWEVNKVNNMSKMFNNASSFSQDLSDWCVVNVIAEPDLFYEGSGLVNEQLPNWGQCPGVVGSIYLDDNGVTVKADEYASVGETYILEETGEEYLVVNEEMLRSMVEDYKNNDLSKVVTSRLTKIQQLFFEKREFNQDISSWDVSNVQHMFGLFQGASSFNQDISNWDVSKVTNMEYFFSGASSFNQNISSWDVANVERMSYMFLSATNFNQNISNWDVSKVTSIDGMFSGATSFNQPVVNWNTSNVITMQSMFSAATSFNQPIGNWDVSKVKQMDNMFSGAYSFNQPIGNWDISNVELMQGMFRNATSFNQPIENWDVSSVTNMDYMFQEATIFNQNLTNWCTSSIFTTPNYFARNSALNPEYYPIWGCKNSDLGGVYLDSNGVTVKANENAVIGNTYILEDTGEEYLIVDREMLLQMASNHSNNDLTKVVTTNVRDMSSIFRNQTSFNQNIGSWDVSNVTTMTSMFQGAAAFNQDIGSWDTANVTSISSMFQDATSFNQDIQDWNVSKVYNMRRTFTDAITFNQSLANWDVSSVSQMLSMFQGAIAFNQPLGNWNISNVRDISFMFHNATTFDQPLNNWDVSNVYTMQSLFHGSESFNQDLSNWNVSNVQNMSGLFSHSNFNKPLESWDVGNVTNFEAMFWNNNGFNQPLNQWNVSNATNMVNMFLDASGFDQDLSNWNVQNVIDFGGMFSNTIFNQDISNWDVSGSSRMSWMFSGASYFNQNLSNWDVSNVTEINYMLQNASSFNQDLSQWCVYFLSDVTNEVFATGSALDASKYPVWGTCPTEDVNDDDGDGVPNFVDQCPGTTDDAFIDENGCYEPRITCPLALTPGTWTVKMFDSYGDGWQTTTSEGGSGLQLYLNSTTVFKEFGLCGGSANYDCIDEPSEATVTFEMPQGVEYIYWKWPGDSYGENSVEIYSPNGELFLTVNPGTQAKFLEVEGCQ